MVSSPPADPMCARKPNSDRSSGLHPKEVRATILNEGGVQHLTSATEALTLLELQRFSEY
jgi:hypothetical protein